LKTRFRQARELLTSLRPSGHPRRRCSRRISRSGRRRLDTACTPSRLNRQDCRPETPETLRSLRHLRCHPAPSRHVRLGRHSSHQQRHRRPNHRHSRLRHSRRPKNSPPRPNGSGEENQGVSTPPTPPRLYKQLNQINKIDTPHVIAGLTRNPPNRVQPSRGLRL